MKKTILSLLAFCALSVSAQNEIVVGDMNDDGDLTVSDVTALTDAVLHPEKVRTISTKCDPDVSEPAAIAGYWTISGGTPLHLASDGRVKSCADTRVKQFEYYPYGRLLVLLDASGDIVSDYIVVRKNADVLVLQQLSGTYISHEFVKLVESISLSAETLTLADDESATLTVTILPVDANDCTYTWSSSDENIALVTENGIVVANGYGTCTITATANDGSGVKAECVVEVQMVHNGHEYVDLGLPSGTLWATTNVGADNPEDYGYYISWGETGPKSTYSWSNYFDGGSSINFNKYYNNGGKTELDLEDDAAYVNWGEGWRMPSFEQIKELYNTKYVKTEWVTQNGKNGRLITSKSTGASLFLPGAGDRYSDVLYRAGSLGDYWSRSLNASASDDAYYLRFSSISIGWESGNRFDGLSIRPVRVSTSK